jgi:hypothetical protein
VASEGHEAALSEAPQAVAEEMSHATERLRDQAWMVAPLTTGVLEQVDPAELRSRAS